MLACITKLKTFILAIKKHLFNKVFAANDISCCRGR